MTPSTTPNNLPTRQQLDEIDALLRRMLTLPPMGDPAGTTSPQTAPGSYMFPPPVVREVPSTAPAVPGDPRVQSWRVEWPQQPAPGANPQSVVAWGSPVPTAVEPQPPWALAAPPMAAPSMPHQPPFAAPAPTEPSSTSQPTQSIFILLLMALNGIFNLITYLLGPLGTWLRGSGRGLMGWVGIAMIIAAAVWALGEWYGYDWPKPNWSRLGVSR